MQEMQEVQVRSLGQEGPLEFEMAIHPSILAWKIPWTEEPGGLHGVAKSRTRLSDRARTHHGQETNTGELLSTKLPAFILIPLAL